MMSASSSETNNRQLRIVLHVDMDSFFASVEVRERPELKSLPVQIPADVLLWIIFPAGGSLPVNRLTIRWVMPFSLFSAFSAPNCGSGVRGPFLLHTGEKAFFIFSSPGS